MGLIVGKQVAYHLGALCHEETLTMTELLLLQLADISDLILTNCHRLHRFYTQFLCKVIKNLR